MQIENLEGLISEHPFFKGLSRPHLDLITGCATNVTFPAGDFVLREGGPAERFFVLRQGRAALEVFVPGKGAVSIETLDAGDVIGWSWLFPPYESHFDVRALTFVRALAFDGACLRGKCEHDAALGYDLLKRVALLMLQRIEATRMQLLDLYGDTAPR